jgi:two-component system response regulator AtoC
VADRILIVDDDDGLRESLELVLAAEGYEVSTAANADDALDLALTASPEVVLCDLRMPGMDGLELLPELGQRLPEATLIMMSAYGSADLAVEAMQRGAYDYLAKPFNPSELLLVLRKAQERERLRRSHALLQRDFERRIGNDTVIAAAPAMQEVLELATRAAGYKATVLLTGESGTGKEVLARAVHSGSPRAEQSFVPINCGAIPENLLESELFGHSRGAFTGADKARRGLFVEADQGTIFLDEIGELPLALQVKLLRVLQEEEVRPVGDSKDRTVDVRVIAATSRDLQRDVAAGQFREDLFYRLNVVHIEVPPLRERVEDIPVLAGHFLGRLVARLGRPELRIGDDAMQVLCAYAWPGNVRELENSIERAVILSDGIEICAEDLPKDLLASGGAAGGPGAGSGDLSLKKARRALEIELIQRALERTDGNRTHAAKELGISHRALLYKLKEYGLKE